MDHFERELSRMMRDAQENTPFEERYRRRLRAGIRARRETRTVLAVAGSTLTVAGLGVGLMVLPGAFAEGGSTGPQHRPASTAPGPVPATSVMPAPWRKPGEPKRVPEDPGTPTARPAPWQTPTKPRPLPIETGTSTTK
ncbi:hypothetical protein [Streptomyces sp. NPDC015125]|uniref:hypothetical protein n=1 Tax=Streptomyces sp. NPDC015125 TaxID=3364938 RepID=UPI0036FE6077